MKLWLAILSALVFTSSVQACLWDADTLSHEKSRSHDLATTILGPPMAPDDPGPLLARIKTLEAKPDTNNPDWWNNLAGAYIRLNQSATAVKLLEPVVSRFPDNYGMHANLGTAYHLLGRYADAEKEIARDLELNAEAHFGLEKYHLALLQYLMRGTNYQSRHLYVEEYTGSFLISPDEFFVRMPSDNAYAMVTNNTLSDPTQLESEYTSLVTNASVGDKRLGELLARRAALDPKPAYCAKWNLAKDTNFEQGVINMAQLNPKEPACFEMLGVAAWKKRDYNLAAAAFEKAISLGSPDAQYLKVKVAGFKQYISESLAQKRLINALLSAPFVMIALVLFYNFYRNFRRMRRSCN